MRSTAWHKVKGRGWIATVECAQISATRPVRVGDVVEIDEAEYVVAGIERDGNTRIGIVVRGEKQTRAQ